MSIISVKKFNNACYIDDRKRKSNDAQKRIAKREEVRECRQSEVHDCDWVLTPENVELQDQVIW